MKRYKNGKTFIPKNRNVYLNNLGWQLHVSILTLPDYTDHTTYTAELGFSP